MTLGALHVTSEQKSNQPTVVFVQRTEVSRLVIESSNK